MNGKMPEIDKIYRHFKGGYYLVLEIAENTESGEKFVIYRKLGDEEATVWARPLSGWMKPVQTPEGEVPRFVEIEPIKEFGVPGRRPES